jgi:NAD(P)H-hydrate epimerase
MAGVEQAAFEGGLRAEDLMETAGEALARVVLQFHHEPGTCFCFFGKGHNGGDALVAARHLAQGGWRVVEEPSAREEELTPLTASRLSALRAVPQGRGGAARVALDGILGIGAQGVPRHGAIAAIGRIASLRETVGAWVLAIDIPSGLDPHNGRPSGTCVTAHLTAAIGFAKSGLVADAAINHVGRLAVIPLPGLHPTGGDAWRVATPDLLHLPPLPFDRHKGQAGRVAVVAGAPGTTGAAVLCSAACARAGAGLVTLHAGPHIAAAVSATCVPEVMVRATDDIRDVLDCNADVLALGPGLGRERDAGALALIRDFPGPAVVDADALNALEGHLPLLRQARGPRLLTPHPGEMERLSPRGGRSRREWAASFATQHGCVLLLKGARSIVACPDGSGFYNTTGGPGMACGGMGDVLAGVASALLADGTRDAGWAAAIAAWACGRAAEHGARSPESLLASDVIAGLDQSFAELRGAPLSSF